jgi:hypothetical protein
LWSDISVKPTRIFYHPVRELSIKNVRPVSGSY